jgi:hypothetical protein
MAVAVIEVLTRDQARALAKVRKCLALAADGRGDRTTRETAWRQAQVLIQKHGLQLERFAATPAPAAASPALVVPDHTSPDWPRFWAQRTAAEAMRAGLSSAVLCRDGWYVPG